jgi:hypothetical protein
MILSRRRAVLLTIAALACAACGPSPTGPLPGTQLPPYASRTRDSLASYRFAVAQPRLLAQLPCYCNCGRTAGHGNLRDCFVSAAGRFTDHAAYCQICQEEALDAKRLHAQGRGVAEIRHYVDATYAGRGQPTDTPTVQGP